MADTNTVPTEGKIVKMEVDYSVTCDEKIPECKKMASEGKLHDALEILLALEKQTRTVSFSNYIINISIVTECSHSSAFAYDTTIKLCTWLRLHLGCPNITLI